ncbi:unnamed protein product [Malus baccata var. baccata]
MEDSLAKLERIQTQILERISKLELSNSASLPQSTSTPIPSLTQSSAVGATEARLSAILLANGVKDFSFKRVASDYYDWSLDARRNALRAASIHHLCKSIVLVNTQAQSSVVDCSDRNNSKYYVVVVQVIGVVVGYAVRLAPEDTSIQLTGFEHNAVTCVGMKTDIPLFSGDYG